MRRRERAGAFVGRREELSVLERMLGHAASGDSAAVAIVGDLGIGKTRLMSELRTIAEAAGFGVIVGRGSELEQEVPFAVAVDALDDHVAGLDANMLRRLGDERVAELGTIFPSLTGVDTALASSLEVERFRGHHAVRAVLRQLALQRPMLLAFDDVHWADRGSLELVCSLLRRRVPRSLLVLATRPGGPHILTAAITRAEREKEIVSLALEPLSRDEATELLDGEVGASRMDTIYAESGGNPFYLEQLARAEDGSRPVPPASDAGSAVPEAVVAAIGQTLAKLPARARQLARAAAVIGDRFDVDVAGEIARLEPGDVLEALDELFDAGVVRSTETPARLSFRHPIVRRAVYDSAGPGWRLDAHGRAARTLARRGAPIAVRAHHVERSARVGDADAVRLLIHAAEHAASRAPATAARWLEAAVRLMAPDAPREQRIALLTSLAREYAACGRLRESRGVLTDALGLLAPEDREARLRLTAGLVRAEQGLGNGEEAGRLLAVALAHTEPESLEAAALMLEQTKHHLMMCRWDAAAAAAVRARELVAPEDREARLRLTAGLARAEQGLGNGEEAGRLLAVALAHTEPESLEAAALMLEQTKHLLMMCRWDAAAAAAVRARELARRYEDRTVFLTSMASLAFVETFRADRVSPEASALCDSVSASLDALGDDVLAPELLDALAQLVYAEASIERWASAASHAERGIRLCRATGQGALFVDFMHLLANSLVMRGRLDEARSAAETAVEAAMMLDNDQFLVITQGTLCWVASQQGDTSAALNAGRNAREAAGRAPRSLYAWHAGTCYGHALISAGEPELGRREILALGGPELTDVPPTSRPRWYRVLTEAELALGRIDAADAMARRAEAQAHRAGLTMRSGEARHARALVLLARGEIEPAARTAREAADLLDASGTRIEAALARLTAARALTEADAVADAERELTFALEAFRAGGAARLADRAARELRRIGRPTARTARRDGSAVHTGPLSRREREVAELVARGYTNRQIADELFVSQKTIETHLAHVFRKLGVSRRAAVASAVGRWQAAAE